MNSQQEQILIARTTELEKALSEKQLELQHKNRELEIEAALERVRAGAMAMHHSGEIPEVAHVIWQQLADLKLADFDGCAILVLDEDGTNTYDSWYAFPENVQGDRHVMGVTKYAQDCAWVIKEMFAKYRVGESEIIVEMNPAQINEFLDWVELDNPALTKEIRGMNLQQLFLYAFPYSNGVVTSYAFKNLRKETSAVLKRITGVFDMAYRRFRDLQKAEALAREAQIEVALEKVRSRSLAMHKSDELVEVMSVMFEKMTDLNVLLGTIAIQLFDEKTKSCDFWIDNKLQNPALVKLPYDEKIMKEDAYMQACWEAKARGESIFNEIETHEKINRYFDYVFANNDENTIPIPVREFIRQANQHVYCLIIEKNSALFADCWTGQLYAEEQIAVLKRVAKVFDQAYVRFLDLQKAEAQARESQIQLALERVRARTMAMQYSSELREIAAAVHEQLQGLGFTSGFCSIVIMDRITGNMTWWMFFPGKEYPESYDMPFFEHPFYLEQLNKWKQGEKYSVIEVSGEEKKLYDKHVFSQTEFVKVPIESQQFMMSFEKIIFSNAYMKHGAFSWGVDPIDDEHSAVLQRFASVFEQCYTRFLDLQKAEEQAREAQVEAALERVRSRTLAMHNSDELAETAAVVFKQLISLGIAPNRLYIGIIKDDSGEQIELWATDEDGSKVSTQFTGNINRNQSIRKMYEGWKAQQKSITIDMQGKELEDYFHYLSEELKVPFHLGLTQTRRVQSIAYFSQGFIGMASPDAQPEETTKLLERFAYVFNLTYTRFNDLQHSEEQTRKAQIEVALERVRARALAMQTSGELIEVAYAMREQMGLLGQPDMETTAVHLYTKDSDTFESWYAFRPGRQSTGEIITGTATFAVDSCELVREFVALHFSGANEYTLEVNDSKQLEWNAVLAAAIPFITEAFYQEFKGPLPKTYFHFSDFSGGSLVMVTYQPPSQEAINLQRRAASVFDLAYRRFLDLQHKEDQALKLLQEKQRLEFTLTELRATQSQLIQSEKMASLGELTAGIAHEIQNPLNFVNNFSEVSNELIDEMNEELGKGDIEEAKAIASDIQQNLEKITHHGKRAEAIVKGMLQHSRTSSGQKELTDLNALADEYLRLSYHGLRAKDKTFNADFKTDFDESIGSINIIPQDIGRVLLNLYNNAFYAVAEKKKQQPEGYEPTVSVSTKKANGKIEVSVKDNGNGIPQKIVDKIFQPFFTTKPTGQGTGLGLSLSYDIVKAHSGEIKVESKEREGTTFTIHLPV
ncbi:MAG TPA: ATP-binding protein [Panacibacter sp.]|nr:ATP-binding protein [Panacibacter sp.]